MHLWQHGTLLSQAKRTQHRHKNNKCCVKWKRPLTQAQQINTSAREEKEKLWSLSWRLVRLNGQWNQHIYPCDCTCACACLARKNQALTARDTHTHNNNNNNRDFKTQQRDGDKNVAEKVNLRYFSLYSDYSYPLTLSIVGEPSWSWISRDQIQAQKEK